MLLGFPAGASEAGQRGTKPHPAAGGALYSFLQLLEIQKETSVEGITKANIRGDEFKGVNGITA